MLQSDAECCSVFRYVVVCCSDGDCDCEESFRKTDVKRCACVGECCNVLQSVSLCFSTLQRVALLQFVAVCCSIVQYSAR